VETGPIKLRYQALAEDWFGKGPFGFVNVISCGWLKQRHPPVGLILLLSFLPVEIMLD